MSDPKRSRSLWASVYNSMAQAVMIGAGENFVSAFGIFLKGTPQQIGTLTTLGPLVGSLFHAVGLWLTEKFSLRRKLLVWGSLAQALIWIPVALIPYSLGLGSGAVSLFILLVVAYHALGGIMFPAWNSLMGDLVPANQRGEFFGFRNKWSGVVTFGSMVISGALLSFCSSRGQTALGFMFIFGAAFLGRAVSALYFRAHEDPHYSSSPVHHFSFLQFLLRSPKSNFARFVFFFGAMHFSIMISGPFFSLRMLDELHFSYIEFTALSCVSLIAQIATMQHWGRLADRFGAKKIMTVCGIGLGFSPLFWLISSAPWFLILSQLFVGAVYAGFVLAGSNFLFDAVSPPKRARCVAYQAIINAVLVFLGAQVGSYLLVEHRTLLLALGSYPSGSSVYNTIFALSAACRFVVAGLSFFLFKEVREVEKIRHHELVFEMVNFRPLSGSTYRLVSGRQDRTKISHD